MLKTSIVGWQYYIENSEERLALNMLAPGTELLLFREPDNEHDEWAVAVYLTDTDKLGFISRFKNETIARLMDAGKKFIAVVDDPKAEDSIGNESSRNRRAPTESMMFPFSVYLVEES